LDNQLFQEIFRKQQESDGRAYWNDLYEKYSDQYVSKEALRSAFKQEKRKRIETGEIPDARFEESSQVSISDDEINIRVTTSEKRFTKKEDIIKRFDIDTTIWDIEKFIIKTNEAWRKDKSISWHVSNGRVSEGHVEDTGKILIVPIYNIEIRFTRKKAVSSAKDAIRLLKEDARKFSPIYPKISYQKISNGLMFEPSIPDIHFGRESWEEVSNFEYNIEIAEKMVIEVLEKLFSRISIGEVDKILLPLGNDFFNVDNHVSTTTRGTFQDEDTLWQKTFTHGRMLAVRMIDTCSQFAPVEVKIIPGNHDMTRSFFLGDSLECWYHNNMNVSIDNSPMPRKYFCYGKNLVGFSHGHSEKISNLPLLMAIEQPENWGKTEYREFHTGHFHNKKDYVLKTDESGGVVVRILRALASPDAWTFNKGFIRSVQAAEGFLWDRNEGVVQQITARPSAK
jgi:hypothetical protein